jgi:hypothetical protein
VNRDGNGGRDQDVSQDMSGLSVCIKAWIEHDGQFVIRGESRYDLDRDRADGS